jgi:hypothetical protein
MQDSAHIQSTSSNEEREEEEAVEEKAGVVFGR